MAKLALAAAAVLFAGWGLQGAAARAGQFEGLDDIGSSAGGVAARFVSDGTATDLPPLPFTAAGGGWRYHRTEALPTLNETLGIAAAGQQIATLQITATKLVTRASSGGASIEAIDPTASGTIASVQITLQPYPLPSGSPPPLLSITLSGVTWQAADSESWPSSPVVTGTADIPSGTITGSLVNGDTVNIAGTQGPNDSTLIPLSTGSTRLTLNQQITAGKVTCASACKFVAYGITTDALAIHLDQVLIGSHSVSGDITVGVAEAHIRP